MPASPLESGPVKGLTPIHERIHCPDTFRAFETDDELDRMHIDNFLETLAEVALAVAKRKEQVGK